MAASHGAAMGDEAAGEVERLRPGPHLPLRGTLRLRSGQVARRLRRARRDASPNWDDSNSERGNRNIYGWNPADAETMGNNGIFG